MKYLILALFLSGCTTVAPPADTACTKAKIDSLAEIVTRIENQCFFGTPEDDPD